MRKVSLHWAHTVQTQDSRVNSQGTLLNLIPQISLSQGRMSGYSLVQRPGICVKATQLNRALGTFTISGKLYVLTQDKLLKVEDLEKGNYTFEEQGSHELRNPARIAVGDGEVIYTDGTRLYSYIPAKATEAERVERVSIFADNSGLVGGEAGSALDATDTLPEEIIDVTWSAGRFVIAVNETLEGRKQSFIYPSHISLSTANALGRVYRVGDRTQANAREDGIVALASLSGNMYVFGANTIEVLYNSGESEGQVFRRYPQAYIDEIGCVSKETVVSIDDRIYFVSAQGGAYYVQEASLKKVSTQAEDRIFALPSSKLENTVCWRLEWGSHKLYHIKLAKEKDAFVYDFSTQLWHRHRIGKSGSFHRSVSLVGNRAFAVSSRETLDEISCPSPVQYGLPVYCECISEPFSMKEGIFRVPSIEFLINMGDGTGSVYVDVSWDDGATWVHERELPLNRSSRGGFPVERPRAVAYQMGNGRRLSVRARSQTSYPIVFDHMVLSVDG